LKKISAEDLAQADGHEGRPAYVVVDGRVYDVGRSKKWSKGVHMRRHKAGADLTADIKSAPHGAEVLGNVDLLGELESNETEEFTGIRTKIEPWLNRFPFFRRHPHPAIVHIPIGALTAALLFELLALLFKSDYTEWASFCCLALAAFAAPPAIATGYLTWWINYEKKDSRVLAQKRRFAWILLCVLLVTVVVRLTLVGNTVDLFNPATAAYLLFLVTANAVVTYVGFLGGSLIFPYE
jgi:predicted heme/steroid binding protein/uncharacterized membrane protein